MVRLKADESLGQLLKRWRKSMGWSHDDAATAVGAHQSQWTRWENDKGLPSGKHLAKIALASEGELSLPTLIAAIESRERAAS